MQIPFVRKEEKWMSDEEYTPHYTRTIYYSLFSFQPRGDQQILLASYFIFTTHLIIVR